MSELDDFARSVGGDYPYVYLNYAAESQNPLRSYGEENLELLKALATEYDPQGIFQTQLHGGFKVSLA
jgi:FAD/FMN-containing dehydrogenase